MTNIAKYRKLKVFKRNFSKYTLDKNEVPNVVVFIKKWELGEGIAQDKKINIISCTL